MSFGKLISGRKEFWNTENQLEVDWIGPQRQPVPCGFQKARVLMSRPLHLGFKSRNVNVLEVKGALEKRQRGGQYLSV